ncbi:hypothetical protein SPBR_04521 [Sporothrix brasiliensis 5110]|uniref:Uncharacterized protein n=1 Tax=Sporothrix brasiliensis 5110 TaxID=1398154 RepID=A0A0C2F3S3_9PEZI|nr:uncharacterized protein SPBR_04521 [Sporothrix brasiliensis 5110]KIH93569.1 hypothetical protein SPBR_04521 [Sporothrix brasiliensis 5110]
MFGGSLFHRSHLVWPGLAWPGLGWTDPARGRPGHAAMAFGWVTTKHDFLANRQDLGPESTRRPAGGGQVELVGCTA